MKTKTETNQIGKNYTPSYKMVSAQLTSGVWIDIAPEKIGMNAEQLQRAASQIVQSHNNLVAEGFYSGPNWQLAE